MSIENIKKLKEDYEKRPPRKQLINRVSDKRKAEEKEYLKLREEFLKKYSTCMFPGCSKRAKDIHHAAGKVGKNYLDEETFIPLCREHHILVELNPKFSKAMGLSKSRLIK